MIENYIDLSNNAPAVSDSAHPTKRMSIITNYLIDNLNYLPFRFGNGHILMNDHNQKVVVLQGAYLGFYGLMIHIVVRASGDIFTDLYYHNRHEPAFFEARGLTEQQVAGRVSRLIWKYARIMVRQASPQIGEALEAYNKWLERRPDYMNRGLRRAIEYRDGSDHWLVQAYEEAVNFGDHYGLDMVRLFMLMPSTRRRKLYWFIQYRNDPRNQHKLPL